MGEKKKRIRARVHTRETETNGVISNSRGITKDEFHSVPLLDIFYALFGSFSKEVRNFFAFTWFFSKEELFISSCCESNSQNFFTPPTPNMPKHSQRSGKGEKSQTEKVNDQTTPLAEKESSNTHAARGELTENHKTIKREWEKTRKWVDHRWIPGVKLPSSI